ncbi:hypothetical protein HK098_006261 [Nowakowskiella sp. JEL0407]|nr:hypothetical protein HK098_006261 [Nowakowskiella sp. JEL0407]
MGTHDDHHSHQKEHKMDMEMVWNWKLGIPLNWLVSHSENFFSSAQKSSSSESLDQVPLLPTSQLSSDSQTEDQPSRDPRILNDSDSHTDIRDFTDDPWIAGSKKIFYSYMGGFKGPDFWGVVKMNPTMERIQIIRSVLYSLEMFYGFFLSIHFLLRI